MLAGGVVSKTEQRESYEEPHARAEGGGGEFVDARALRLNRTGASHRRLNLTAISRAIDKTVVLVAGCQYVLYRSRENRYRYGRELVNGKGKPTSLAWIDCLEVNWKRGYHLDSDLRARDLVI